MAVSFQIRTFIALVACLFGNSDVWLCWFIAHIELDNTLIHWYMIGDTVYAFLAYVPPLVQSMPHHWAIAFP